MAELLDPADRDVQAFAPKAPFFSISNTGRRRVAGVRNRVGTSNDRDDPGACWYALRQARCETRELLRRSGEATKRRSSGVMADPDVSLTPP
jgi:hypothetical protein